MNTNTRRSVICIFLLFFILTAFSYAGGNKAAGRVPFSEVKERDWKLIEVKNKSDTISIDRTKAAWEIYTIRFETDFFIGEGAANIYFASYNAEKNHDLSSGEITSTRMSPIFEMEDFKEDEYFKHLERVNCWDIRNKKLKLYTCDENGDSVILTFLQRSAD